MAEQMTREDTQREGDGLDSTTVGIYRTAAVVKGGRRFSFGALVVVGDRNGRVGLGYGKAPGVPAAIEKAQKEAKKSLEMVRLEGSTLPHAITAEFGASTVKMVPAAPGTGVIAGATVRAVLELAGVRDCLTKVYGSTNQKNLCKATYAGLMQLRQKAQVEALRGVTLEKTEVQQRLELGEKYAPTVVATEKATEKAAAAQQKDKSKDKSNKGGRPKTSKKKDRGEARAEANQPKPPAEKPAEPEAPGANAAPAEQAGSQEAQKPADESSSS